MIRKKGQGGNDRLVSCSKADKSPGETSKIFLLLDSHLDWQGHIGSERIERENQNKDFFCYRNGSRNTKTFRPSHHWLCGGTDEVALQGFTLGLNERLDVCKQNCAGNSEYFFCLQ